MGKSTINGPFSIAMLVYQRVNGKYVVPISWCPLPPKERQCLGSTQHGTRQGKGLGGPVFFRASRIGSVVNPYITLVILYVIGDIHGYSIYDRGYSM